MNTLTRSDQTPGEVAASPVRNTRDLARRSIVPALWVSAGVLLALILFRSEHLTAVQPVWGIGDRAQAGMLGTAGNFTMLTSEATNEDLVLILDGRSEELFVYKPDNQGAIQLFQRVSLSRMFVDARARAQGSN